jgi:Ser/Thr protein kinase RdoA (MazF antagonist)
MKPYAELTYHGQVRRVRRLAQGALEQYGLPDAQMSLVGHGENTTFRVTSPATGTDRLEHEGYVTGRYLLRVHRPGYQTHQSLASELAWLAALRETGLVVPAPVPARSGEFLVEVAVAGLPEPRYCSLLCWVRGRLLRRRIRPQHFAALGQLMARLHAQSVHWQLPTGFTRRHWDGDGLFGDRAGFHLPAREVWALLPQPYAEIFQPVAEQARQAMDRLGQGSDALGLIHADLFLGAEGNVLFDAGEARPVDFDDCGFGYWIYDLAVPLSHWQTATNWPSIREALLGGYAQVHSLPEGLEAHLDLFMAARHVSEILWATDMAQVNPGFRKELAGWLEWAAAHVRRYLELG